MLLKILLCVIILWIVCGIFNLIVLGFLELYDSGPIKVKDIVETLFSSFISGPFLLCAIIFETFPILGEKLIEKISSQITKIGNIVVYTHNKNSTKSKDKTLGK